MFGRILLAGVGLVLILSTSTLGSPYWYGVDGPEQLKIDSFKIAILYNDSFANVKHASSGRIVGILDEPRAVDGHGKGEMA